MLSFSDFLAEAAAKVKDPNYGLSNDSKGKLHEILTAHYLTHGDHNNEPHEHKIKSGTHFPRRPGVDSDAPAAEAYHKFRGEIAKKSGKDADAHWQFHKDIARSAAKHITQALKSKGVVGKGEKITNVYHTSNPSDIGALHEPDKANKSDLVVETHTHVGEVDKKAKSQRGPGTKKHFGLSMKIHNQPKPSTLSNPGSKSMDSIFNVNTEHHHNDLMDKAHGIAEKHGIDTRTIAKAKAHDLVKNHSANDELKPHTRKSVEAVAGAYASTMHNAHPHEIADKLSKLANIQKTKMPTYFAASYGTEGKISHHVDDPHEEFHKILNAHRDHLHTEHKGNIIKFKGKGGTTLGTLQVKYKSSTPFKSQPVGVLGGWTSGAKKSVE